MGLQPTSFSALYHQCALLVIAIGIFVVATHRYPPLPKVGAAALPPSSYTMRVLTTGYCSGQGLKCGIHPRWDDGYTATGTKARRGSCAIDRRVFKTTDRFYVPGYGFCRGEDTGNRIRGYHLDLYFESYTEAMRWGRRYVTIEVYHGHNK